MRRTLTTCDRCGVEITGPTRVKPSSDGPAHHVGMEMVPADDRLRDLCAGCATAVPWRGTYLVRWMGREGRPACDTGDDGRKGSMTC